MKLNAFSVSSRKGGGGGGDGVQGHPPAEKNGNFGLLEIMYFLHCGAQIKLFYM